MVKAQEILDKKYYNEIETIFQEEKNNNLIKKLFNKEYRNNFSYYKLKSMYYRIEDLYFQIKDLFEKVEIEKYASNTLEIEELREIYKKKKLYDVYPNLNFERLKEIYDNPPQTLKSPAYKSHILYDKVVVQKYVIGIIQMIFNNMDLVVTFCGREGTGKTTASTQDAYLCYWILSEIGIIDYDYRLPDTMYHNLKTIIDGFNKYVDEPFRIFILDEGNELNRKDWGNPLVQLFFQKLRRERSHLRIVFINLPQIGELMPSITLSRVNFIFQLNMKINSKTKLAEKGKTYFYIVPRFNKIYSYLNKTELYQDYVINEMGRILDDKKKYLQTLPLYLAIHKFERNGVWSFKEGEYEKRKKKANAEFSTSNVNLTKSEMYFLWKYLDLKKLDVKPGTKAYFILTHLKNKKINVAVKGDDSIKSAGEYMENNGEEKINDIE